MVPSATCCFLAAPTYVPFKLSLWAQVAFGVYLNAAIAFCDVFVKEQPSLMQILRRNLDPGR